VPPREALDWEYAEMEDLSPRDSMIVGEENDEIVETDTFLVLCRIQSVTLTFGGVTSGAPNAPVSGSCLPPNRSWLRRALLRARRRRQKNQRVTRRAPNTIPPTLAPIINPSGTLLVCWVLLPDSTGGGGRSDEERRAVAVVVVAGIVEELEVCEDEDSKVGDSIVTGIGGADVIGEGCCVKVVRGGGLKPPPPPNCPFSPPAPSPPPLKADD